MSTLMQTAERIAAAGCSRAVPSYVGAAAFAGSAASPAVPFRGWHANPTQGMQVEATKRHDLTPAPRPEDGSP